MAIFMAVLYMKVYVEPALAANIVGKLAIYTAVYMAVYSAVQIAVYMANSLELMTHCHYFPGYMGLTL